MDEYEIVKRNVGADVEVRLLMGVYEVYAGSERIARTRVLASALAEHDHAVYERSEKARAKRAAERANGAYIAMASENGAARSSRARRGGKGGRGGV